MKLLWRLFWKLVTKQLVTTEIKGGVDYFLVIARDANVDYEILAKEFKRLYAINRDYTEDETYYYLLDTNLEEGTTERSVQRMDYESRELDIIPGADPNITSDAQRILRAQSLEQKLAAGFPLNPQEVTKASLEAEGHENIEALMTVPIPQTPPDIQLELDKFQHQKIPTEALEVNA